MITMLTDPVSPLAVPTKLGNWNKLLTQLPELQKNTSSKAPCSRLLVRKSIEFRETRNKATNRIHGIVLELASVISSITLSGLPSSGRFVDRDVCLAKRRATLREKKGKKRYKKVDFSLFKCFFSSSTHTHTHTHTLLLHFSNIFNFLNHQPKTTKPQKWSLSPPSPPQSSSLLQQAPRPQQSKPAESATVVEQTSGPASLTAMERAKTNASSSSVAHCSQMRDWSTNATLIFTALYALLSFWTAALVSVSMVNDIG